MVNFILAKLDAKPFRWILCMLIRTVYLIRRKEPIKNVFYHKTFKLWGYQFTKTFFWNTGPGWITSKKYFESQLRRYFANQYQPKNGDIVIDLGAGLGEEAILMSDWVGETGKVYAVEATPRIAKALTYAKEVNKLDNLLVFNLAINHKNEGVEIFDDHGYVGNTINTTVKNMTNSFAVPGITFDEFFHEQGLKHVDLLKVNIEGAEQFMIMGMDKSVSKIKNIAVSCHDFRFVNNGESEFYKTMNVVKSFFNENGFSITLLATDDILQRHIVFGKNLAFLE